MEIDKNTAEYKRSRVLYTGEAAFEYLIALLVEGTFLARLTTYLGFDDGLTGIMSSFISLGCLFQLFSMFIRRRTVKRFVVIMSVINQLMFMMLYVVPVTPLPSYVKTVAFVVFLFGAYIIYYLTHPKKMGWLMSLVEDDKRGIFTANKEIISLASGIVFTYAMGYVVDYFKDRGEIRTAFIICGAVIFALTVIHTLSLLFSVEDVYTEDDKPQSKNVFKQIFSMFKEKIVLQIAVIYVLWNIGNHGAVCFFSTYKIKELGFSQTLSVVLVSIGSVTRMLISRAMGRYGDKHSFTSLIKIGFILAAIAYCFTVFARPETLFTVVFNNGASYPISSGLICFVFYHIFHGAASASINSSLLNIIFDYVPYSMRSDALAFCSSIGGLASFGITVVLTPLLYYIQGKGNVLFGIPVYTQQLTSLLGVLCIIGAILYVSLVIAKGKKQNYDA